MASFFSTLNVGVGGLSTIYLVKWSLTSLTRGLFSGELTVQSCPFGSGKGVLCRAIRKVFQPSKMKSAVSRNSQHTALSVVSLTCMCGVILKGVPLPTCKRHKLIHSVPFWLTTWKLQIGGGSCTLASRMLTLSNAWGSRKCVEPCHPVVGLHHPRCLTSDRGLWSSPEHRKHMVIWEFVKTVSVKGYRETTYHLSGLAVGWGAFLSWSTGKTEGESLDWAVGNKLDFRNRQQLALLLPK